MLVYFTTRVCQVDACEVGKQPAKGRNISHSECIPKSSIHMRSNGIFTVDQLRHLLGNTVPGACVAAKQPQKLLLRKIIILE